jgi:hypothetical protein
MSDNTAAFVGFFIVALMFIVPIFRGLMWVLPPIKPSEVQRREQERMKGWREKGWREWTRKDWKNFLESTSSEQMEARARQRGGQEFQEREKKEFNRKFGLLRYQRIGHVILGLTIIGVIIFGIVAAGSYRHSSPTARTMMALAIPTIHLNGTSQESLISGYLDAITALHHAGSVLARAAPNMRDYYVQ